MRWTLSTDSRGPVRVEYSTKRAIGHCDHWGSILHLRHHWNASLCLRCLSYLVRVRKRSYVRVGSYRFGADRVARPIGDRRRYYTTTATRKNRDMYNRGMAIHNALTSVLAPCDCPIGTVVAVVDSFTDPDVDYDIVRDGTGRLHCSCPHHRKTGVYCKHMQVAAVPVIK